MKDSAGLPPGWGGPPLKLMPVKDRTDKEEAARTKLIEDLGHKPSYAESMAIWQKARDIASGRSEGSRRAVLEARERWAKELGPLITDFTKKPAKAKKVRHG